MIKTLTDSLIYFFAFISIIVLFSLLLIIAPINSNQKLRIVEDIGFVGNKGDVNSDGSANIIDLVDIVYTILDDLDTNSIYLWAADMDYNEELNVIDLTKLVSFILLP